MSISRGDDFTTAVGSAAHDTDVCSFMVPREPQGRIVSIEIPMRLCSLMMSLLPHDVT